MRYPPVPGELHHNADSIAYVRCADRGIHVVRPIQTFPADYNVIRKPTVGGHFAITVLDMEAVKSRFDVAGVVYSDVGENQLAGTHQLYVFDPSNNLIEFVEVS